MMQPRRDSITAALNIPVFKEYCVLGFFFIMKCADSIGPKDGSETFVAQVSVDDGSLMLVFGSQWCQATGYLMLYVLFAAMNY